MGERLVADDEMATKSAPTPARFLMPEIEIGDFQG